MEHKKIRNNFIYYALFCCMTLLLGGNLQASNADSDHKDHPLVEAIKSMRPSKFDDFLENNKDININEVKGLITYARKNTTQDTFYLEIILKHHKPKLPANYFNLNVDEAYEAIKTGIDYKKSYNYTFLNTLLEYKPKLSKYEINLNTKKGYETIKYAIQEHVNSARLLVEYGLKSKSYKLNINLKNNNNDTLLHTACYRLIKDIKKNNTKPIGNFIEFLLEKGINAEAVNKNNKTASRLLLEKGADSDSSLPKKLKTIIKAEQIKLAQEQLEQAQKQAQNNNKADTESKQNTNDNDNGSDTESKQNDNVSDTESQPNTNQKTPIQLVSDYIQASKNDELENLLFANKKIDFSQRDDILSETLKNDNLTVFKAILGYRPKNQNYQINLNTDKGYDVLSTVINKENNDLLKEFLRYSPQNKDYQINLNTKKGYEEFRFVISKDNSELVKSFLDYKPSNNKFCFNLNSTYGHDAIIYALQNKQKDILNVFLTHGDLFSEQKFDINKKISDNEVTLIQKVIQTESEDAVSLLLQQAQSNKVRIDLTLEDKNKKNAIVYAIDRGDQGIINVLLKNKNDYYSKFSVTKKDIMYVLNKEKKAILDTLLGEKIYDIDSSSILKKALQIDIKNENGPIFLKTFLGYKPYEVDLSYDHYDTFKYAIEQNYLKGVKALLGYEPNSGDQGKKFKIKDVNNHTENENLLHVTMKQYNKQTKQKSKQACASIMAALIKAGIDVTQKNKNGKMPIELLKKNLKNSLTNHLESTSLTKKQINNLLNARERKKEGDKIAKNLGDYLTNKNFSEINKILDKNPAISKYMQVPILHKAIKCKTNKKVTLNTVKYLLEANRTIANEKKDGVSHIAAAVSAGRADCIKVLIKYSIDVKEANKALGSAALSGNSDCIAALRGHKTINVNYGEKEGDVTPLITASYSGYTACVKELLKYENIDINYRTKNGTTALLTATKQGHLEVVDMLLKLPGIELTRDDSKKNSEYSLLEAVRFPAILALFLEHPKAQSLLNVTTKDENNGLLHLISKNLTIFKKAPGFNGNDQKAIKLKGILTDVLEKGKIDPTLRNKKGKMASELTKDSEIVEELQQAEKAYIIKKNKDKKSKEQDTTNSQDNNDNSDSSSPFGDAGKILLIVGTGIVGISVVSLYWLWPAYKKKKKDKKEAKLKK